MKIISRLAASTVVGLAVFTSCGKKGPEKSLTAEETVKNFTAQLGKNDATVIWTSLPKTWRKDINGVAHNIGKNVSAKAYDKAFTLVERLAKALVGKKKILADSFATEGTSSSDISKIVTSLSDVLNVLAKSEISSSSKLKSVDLEDFMSGTVSSLLSKLSSSDFVKETLQKTSKDKSITFEKSMSQTKIKKVSETGGVAVLEISAQGKTEKVELVKVEGKWIPKDMKEGFAKFIEGSKAMKKMTPKEETEALKGMETFEAIIVEIESLKSKEDVEKLKAKYSMQLMMLGMFTSQLGK